MPTSTTRPSRAAKTAGPGELLVPELGELVARRDETARFEAHRASGGSIVATWSATRLAGMLLASQRQISEVQSWCTVDGTTQFVELVRFTRKGLGTIPHAEVIGAARTGPVPVEVVEDVSPE